MLRSTPGWSGLNPIDRDEILRAIRNERTVASLRALIAELSDALNHDGIWTSEQIVDLRRRTANALTPEQCPEWLSRYRDPPMVAS